MPWRIALFGDLRSEHGDKVYTHFETRKTGALLACLALFPNRSLSREVLAEELWPDEDPAATRNRLRQALSTLRRVLEQDESGTHPVLLTGRNEARLNLDAVTTDVMEFEVALRTAANAPDAKQRSQALIAAIELYSGELLPGYYEDCISAQRERLSEAHRGALGKLLGALAEMRDYKGALKYAKRYIACDSLSEEAHCALIRLHLDAGHHTDAFRQYKELERVLRDELGTVPSPMARQLLADLNAPAMYTDPQKSPGTSIHSDLDAEGGAVPLNSPFYIVRPGDELFRTAIARQDSIVLIKGARQIGKTSLLARGLQQARESGKRVVLTDLQKLFPDQLESAEALFRTFADKIVDQLDLDISQNDPWNPRRGWNVNFERFLRREVLATLSTPLVWGLDEVDRLFGCRFSGGVFGLFRSWHNERSLNPDGPWARLTLAMAYATEAHLFITDLNQSPFNVGTRVTLDDFAEGELSQLNRLYESPLRSPAEVSQYYRLVGGHPYLVRCGLHVMAVDGLDLSALEAKADREDGVFGDHLRRMQGLLAQDAELCDAMRAVLKGHGCPTSDSFYRLRSAGVVAGESMKEARARCRLYQIYLLRRLF